MRFLLALFLGMWASVANADFYTGVLQQQAQQATGGGPSTGAAVVSIQRKSVTYTAASGTDPTPVTLDTAIVPSQSFLSFSMRGGFTNSARMKRHIWRGELSESAVQFRRFEAASAADVTIDLEVIQFDDTVLVQRGTATITTPVTNISLGSTADPSRSFVILTQSTNQNTLLRDVVVDSEITGAGSTLTLTSFDPTTTDAITVHYQVVTFPAGAANVQRGEISLASGVASNTATLSPAVDTLKTFLVLGGMQSSPSSTGAHNTIQLDLTNATTVTATRTIVGTEPTITASFYAVEMLNGTTVIQASGNIPDTASTPAAQPSFSTMTNPSLVLSLPGNGASGYLDAAENYDAHLLTSISVNGTKDGLIVSRVGTVGQFNFTIPVVDWWKP